MSKSRKHEICSEKNCNNSHYSTGLCKNCYSRKYYNKNPNKKREYVKKNKDKIKVRMAEYHKKYYKLNKNKIIKRTTKRHLEKYKTDINYRLSLCLRVTLNRALKGKLKTLSAISDLGCSLEQLKIYLESKFQPGMTWDNYGYYGWHVDHIKALSKFDLTNPKDLQKAVHYSNLQPLWRKDNQSKGNRNE